MIQINGFSELKSQLKKQEKSYLLLYKSTGNEQNVCAFEHIEQALKDNKNTHVLVADVTTVRDIHNQFNVNAVPTLVEFTDEKAVNHHKGCQSAIYYANLFNKTSVQLNGNASEKAPQKQVTVYSTPSCSWCNTLKNYLNDHGIKYRDIDVSRDQAAAEAMVKRSGQQGVPQTLINGEIIVGFDKNRINQLLNIKNK